MKQPAPDRHSLPLFQTLNASSAVIPPFQSVRQVPTIDPAQASLCALLKLLGIPGLGRISSLGARPLNPRTRGVILSG